MLNLIPDAAIQGVPGIPDPDEVALAEGSNVAGAVPAGQSLHVHFEETDNPDSPMPLEVADVPAVSHSPSRDSPTFEEDWQQVHRGVMEVAEELEINLADHSYATSSSNMQPSRATPSHPTTRPSSPTSTHPSSRASTHSESHPSRRDKDILTKMIEVQTEIRDLLRETNNSLTQIAAAIRYLTDKQ
ncbi:hypothetical protein Pcinc_016434 [Petrolisthes cinctipes]|uniref:Uncharacterized protein n=1 Tax=Petrolisthes cinctipes TaxID=88211 RepID=A0AAE1FSX9_PETCI|nr:hypothetical protein Pcinc_016434 [Petrolisthes cinctipes]